MAQRFLHAFCVAKSGFSPSPSFSMLHLKENVIRFYISLLLQERSNAALFTTFE